MSVRRLHNPGKREREAGKRHRRAFIHSSYDGGAVTETLKLGRKHFRRWSRSLHLGCGRYPKSRSRKGVEEISA
jgi:hypothetical protein